jgi:hypothetical protein
LIELVGRGTGVSLTSMAYGSPNITASAALFAKMFGTTPGVVRKVCAWEFVTVSTKRDFTIQFLDFHDERSTKHLPFKIVIAVPDIAGFKTAITTNGGTTPKG